MPEDKLEKEMKEAIEESTPVKDKSADQAATEAAEDFEEIMNTETALAATRNSLPTITDGIDMAGLDEIPKSDLMLPIIKLVQGTTKDVGLGDGSEAQAGSFMHTADRTTKKEITFSILRVKKIMVQYKESDEPQPNYLLLGALDNQWDENGLFMMRIPLTSIGNFKKIITQIHRQRDKFPHVWDHQIKAWGESREGKQGRYYQMCFEIIGQNDKKTIDKLSGLFTEYSPTLNREDDNPDNERA